MGKIACATGHRPEKFRFKYNEADPECINLKRVLKNEILKLINHGYDYFISGMALGWDMWFAEAVLELKEEYSLTLELAIPCVGQEKTWPEKSQERYQKIKEQADIVTVLSKSSYYPYLMIQRDEYMVDKSNMLVAGYNGSKGGTQHTFSYAIEKGVNIIHINPDTKIIRYIKNRKDGN